MPKPHRKIAQRPGQTPPVRYPKRKLEPAPNTPQLIAPRNPSPTLTHPSPPQTSTTLINPRPLTQS